MMAAALAVTALVGCTTTTPTLEPPDGIQISVHQNRADTADRRLQVRIANFGTSALTLYRVWFSSPAYAEDVEHEKVPAVLGAGRTLDLPVTLPAPMCGVREVSPQVGLEFNTGDRRGVAVVVPDDPLGQLSGIFEQDCLSASIAAIATLTEPESLRTESVGSRLVAFIDLRVQPTGDTGTSGTGTLEITSVDDTVLLSLFDTAQQRTLESLPLGLRIRSGDRPLTVAIPVVPARCDPHAVAEDKRGTLLPLRVTAGERSGIEYFAVSETLKAQLFDFIRTACAPG